MRRLHVVVLAALVGLGSIGAWPAAASDGDVSVVRFGGADRYATSLLVAEAIAADAGGSLSSVVLASGECWADAAVAVPVAGALGSPVLLTPPDELREDLSSFLQRVSVSEVVLVGPDECHADAELDRGVSAAVVDELGDLGISVVRVAGSDPYTTSVAAARRIDAGAMGSHGRTAVVVSAAGLAEALVAGPFAARGVHPLLLTPPDRLHPEVTAYLADAGIEHVVVMGGTGVLSAEVESAIAAAGVTVGRIAGKTLYDIAAETARLAANHYGEAAGQRCFATNTMGVARAGVPFDAISAAPLLGRRCAPLVLVDPERIPADSAALVDAVRKTSGAVTLLIFGGDAAVSGGAIDTYVAGEDPLAECRLRGAEVVVAEFPPLDVSVPSTGTLRVAVLFMDFPTSQARDSTRREADLGLPLMEEYLETVSYGKLDVEVITLDKWLRASEPYSKYLRDPPDHRDLGWVAGRHAVEKADPEFDFSNVDVVFTVFPSVYFDQTLTPGKVVADGNAMMMSLINVWRHQRDQSQDRFAQRWGLDWGTDAVWHIGLSLGLTYLNPFDKDAHARPEAPSGKEWIAVGFGPMSFYSHYLEDKDEAKKLLLRTTENYLQGGYWSRSGALTAYEMLAWNRWQLGWLGDSQVRCLPGTEAVVTLAPIARPSGHVATAIIPLNADEAIVVESRRKIGYDIRPEEYWPRGLGTYRHTALLHDGVLVYTVDKSAPLGQVPIRLADDSGNGQVDGYPVLEVGESVTARGYTITVDADTGNAHVVTITPAG